MVAYHDGDSIASILTANEPFTITQIFGENLDTVPDDWYAYAADVGLNYGEHPGVDIGVPFGHEIHAVADAKVTQSGLAPYFRPYPIYTESKLDDGSNLLLIYGHLSSDVVSEGDTVKRGDLLGYSGAQSIDMEHPTTYNSGPHIHFEARKDGIAIDPTLSLLTTGTVTGGTTANGGTGDSGSVSKDGFLTKFAYTGAGIVLAIVGITFLVLSPIRKAVL